MVLEAPEMKEWVLDFFLPFSLYLQFVNFKYIIFSEANHGIL